MQGQMQFHPSNFRSCATCARWSGPRETDNFGSQVRTPFDARGICQGGAYNGQTTNAAISCSAYIRWPVLR